ncbi:MAG: nucleotidyltransferase family protein, partial [Bacteroidota bacterium]
LGTRLRSVVADQPKVLAPVNDQPFLKYIIDKLFAQDFNHVVLSTGYLHEKIDEFIRAQYPGINISIVVEDEPLGTGGGIAHALKKCMNEEVLILNGDTFFNIDYAQFYHHHHHHQSSFSIALKHMKNFERYGTVVCDQHHRIIAFTEKKLMEEGCINAGAYIINRLEFLNYKWPEKFSMEKDFMEKFTKDISMYGFPYDEYFIDIGIPEDFARAQNDFKTLLK